MSHKADKGQAPTLAIPPLAQVNECVRPRSKQQSRSEALRCQTMCLRQWREVRFSSRAGDLLQVWRTVGIGASTLCERYDKGINALNEANGVRLRLIGL